MVLRINLACMCDGPLFAWSQFFYFLSWYTLSNDWSLGFLPTNGDAKMRIDANLRFKLHHLYPRHLVLTITLLTTLLYVARRNPPPQRLYLTFSPIRHCWCIFLIFYQKFIFEFEADPFAASLILFVFAANQQRCFISVVVCHTRVPSRTVDVNLLMIVASQVLKLADQCVFFFLFPYLSIYF